MGESFIYLWYDASHKMFYLGKHKGSPDDKYTHSSRMWERFNKNNIPKGARRRILAYGTDEEITLLEHKCLVNRKSRCWNKYYNTGLGSFKYIDQSGENNPMWGVKLTEEEKEVRSKKLLSQWQISIEEGGRKGWKPTEEMNRRNSETKKRLFAEGILIPYMLGKTPSEETKKKIGDANRGKTHTPETIKKMCETRGGPNGINVRSGITFAPIEEQRKHYNEKGKKRRNATPATREAYNKYMREYNLKNKEVVNRNARISQRKRRKEKKMRRTLS